MEDSKKEAIVKKLQEYIERSGSANKAANSLRGVSSATINHMVNGKWDLINDDMWRNVAKQIGYTETEWSGVKTLDFRILTKLMCDAQIGHRAYAVTGDAGTGKSFAMRQYTANNREVYYLLGAEYWNKKIFMQELLAAMGRNYSGLSIGEMMQDIIRELKKQENPLIIIDEADKLNDVVFNLFITIYNLLEDHAGIILCATNYLDKRIRRGVKLEKKGYKEINSRIGRKCIELKGLSTTDITLVCEANGITDEEDIQQIFIDCEGDLRRVKRKIHALKNRA